MCSSVSSSGGANFGISWSYLLVLCFSLQSTTQQRLMAINHTAEVNGALLALVFLILRSEADGGYRNALCHKWLN